MSMKDFPIYTTVNQKELEETLEKARNQRYVENVEASVKAMALSWVVAEKIAPAVEGLEFYSGSYLGWTCGYEFQIPLESREIIREWIDRLTSFGWEIEPREADKEDKDRVHRGFSSKGNYIQYALRPGDDLIDEIAKRFNHTFSYVTNSWNDEPRVLSFSKYMIDLRLEFYPTETSECQITNLGEVTIEQTRTVWEVTCREGALEMQELLNGGGDA